MSYLSRRIREIREEEAVPKEVRQDHRAGVTFRFIGKDIDAVTAWRIGAWYLPGDRELHEIRYTGRGA